MFRLLDAAVAGLDADAIAAGVVVDDAVAFVCRGQLGDEDVGRQTIFYGASVTKQFLGILLARAVADRAAAADDLLLSWLPELPHWMAAVRLHHLIHHTSDLPDVTDPGLGILRGNADVIERFRQLRPNPVLQPGSPLRLQQRRLRPARRGAQSNPQPADHRYRLDPPVHAPGAHAHQARR